MKIKGIRYTAPVKDNSGYAKAARGNIMALYKLGIPLTVNPISFEKARPDLIEEESRILNSLINKDIDYNINFIHTTPEFYEKYRKPNKVNVAYTVWENSKLHKSWPGFINNNVDKVVTGSKWGAEIFKKSGVTIPVGVCSHCVSVDGFEEVKVYKINGISDNTFVFYDIFQWCYDEKTRVLTRDGFKYFKNLTYDDEIATLNLKTEELEYQFPNDIVSFKRNDKMFVLKNQGFDVCVTPDHKMVVKEDKDVCYKLIPFNELVSKGKSNQLMISEKYKAKKNCKWIGKEIAVFEIPVSDNMKYPPKNPFPGNIKMDVFLEFLGWFLSEGSTYAAKRGYVNVITQVENEEYIEEIINCIKNMGFNSFKRGKIGNDIVFHSREMHYYLKQFGKAKNKFIPKWVKNLSTRQIKIILNSLFKGDGSLYENGDWIKYTTTSKRLAEDIQECLLKVGLSGSISTTDPILYKPGKIDGRYIRGKLLQYTVSVNRQFNKPSMYYAKLKEIDYNGIVYCATVPNHAMLVERNGKVLFSGNTEKKSPLEVIKTYWATFQDNEDVALIIKTYRSDYSEAEKQAIRTTIQRLKSIMPMDKYPPIYLILEMLSDEQIIALHKGGNCLISLNKGEGVGLVPLQAAAYGNPIIITGWGGSLEYAKPDLTHLVNYTLEPCFGMPYSPWHDGTQWWARADLEHASKLMRHVYENQNEAKEKGLKLKKYISENFTWEHIGKKLIKELEML